ncbi:MAG: CotH kinase family protein [Prevotella sp.]|nr:CotH kinase family protein [Prevotella sp.]
MINELMQSNVECVIDDLNEFPDSWVELYNAGDEAVNLKDYAIGVKTKAGKAWSLPDQTVAPKGYALVYADKEERQMHTSFRLESGKGCVVYLFQGKEIVDSLPEALGKMPSPDVAYGRTSDGADTWGYQLTATPGKSNTGETCKQKQILAAPTFSEKGRVSTTKETITLTLALPDDAPADAYITYTTNGREPTTSDKKYTAPITISKTTVIRAKTFCKGWLSHVSAAESYIFHPRAMTLPVFSVLTNDAYLNGKELGLFYNNNSKEDKKTHDWRRPVNIEFFPTEGGASAFNQLGETRIQGGQSRSNALKSMVFYANKRFDPDHKRFKYEFFPDQKPGISEYKSFSLRDGGNDFGDLYFRDAIIQRTMGQHVDLDWQACHSAVLYINGEYMGMLNIRERSNDDNIYSNYSGLEDIDMVEISHEQVNGKDMFIEELKAGSADYYEAFKTFYSEQGHTRADYEQWMDVSEYLNVMVMNLFYGNLDFPGNNLVFWRPNEDAKVDLPKRWRVIVKDTDFGIGLYGRKNDYNMLRLLYDPTYDKSNSWACSEVATRLFRHMMEDAELRQLFIDKCCVFTGDFMNAEGTGAVMDAIQQEALDEFVAHRDKYNTWSWDNREEIISKFKDAKKWLAGYTESNPWGGSSTTYKSRTENFLSQVGKQYQLDTAVPVTINKESTTLPDTVLVNGIALSRGVFNGRLFPNRQVVIEGRTKGPQIVTGWDIKQTATNGTVTTTHIDGAVCDILLSACRKLSVNAILGEDTGIENEEIIQNSADPATATYYNLNGLRVNKPTKKGLYIVNGKKVLVK